MGRHLLPRSPAYEYDFRLTQPWNLKLSVRLLHDDQAGEIESDHEMRGDHQADHRTDAAHPNRYQMIQAGSEATAGVRVQPMDPRDQQLVGMNDGL